MFLEFRKDNETLKAIESENEKLAMILQDKRGQEQEGKA